MSTDIFEFPPVERPYVAVRRFKLITGEHLFNRLLDFLELSEDEFREEYGPKLIGNPNCLNQVMVKMVHENIKRGRKKCSN